MSLSQVGLLGGVVAGGVVGLAAGGRVRYLGRHPMRSWWLVIPGLLLQVLPDHVDLGGWSSAAWVVGNLCLLALATRNLAYVGIGVVIVGLAANALVIAADGGMPVRPASILSAGITTPDRLAYLDYGRRHHREGPGDHLTWLADVVPVRPLRLVVSFGDLILVVGLADVTAHALQAPRRRHRSGPASDLHVAVEAVEHGAADGAFGAAPPASPLRHETNTEMMSDL